MNSTSFFRSTLQALVLIAALSTVVGFIGSPSGAKLVVSTSAICEMCKERIENSMKDLRGVQAAVLNLDNKKLKVKYQPDQVTPEQIREKIRQTGYAADGVQPDKDAYQALPACCRQPGLCTEGK